jgi:hypothetical protein
MTRNEDLWMKCYLQIYTLIITDERFRIFACGFDTVCSAIKAPAMSQCLYRIVLLIPITRLPINTYSKIDDLVVNLISNWTVAASVVGLYKTTT